MNDLTAQPQGGALVEIASQREMAEVQAMMILAKKFPRDEIEAIERIKTAFARPVLAEQGLYSYSKGGAAVNGLSIRSAEALAQCWGNIQSGLRELSQENGASTVEAYAWDIQTNTRQSIVFQVPHIRQKKSGNQKLTDPREIYELVANMGARRRRACLLGVIPGDVAEVAQIQCDETLNAKADTSPAAVKKMVDAFSSFGVTSEMIEKRIQRKLEAITAAQVVQLRKIYNSLKDGMSGPQDWFEGVKIDTGSKADAIRDRIEEATKEKPCAACGGIGRHEELCPNDPKNKDLP